MSELAFGTGPLSRTAATVHNLLVVEALLVATTLPGLVALLLDRNVGNLPLVALCALPVGPALSAALYALHHRSSDLTELRPAAAFLRGYRLNARGALLVWAFWLGWITVLAVNLANLGAAGLPGWWVAPLLLVGAAATVWMLNALVITSLFAFRFRDVARLAAYLVIRTPGVSLGNCCLVIVVLGGVLASSEAVVALAGSVLVLALLHNSRRLIAVVRKEFTR
ncbi:hypothetical protein GCM10010112_42210 [Actinoplanes lobatus]|uniref:DUF624 domain-containing protein n=1 Tax=Actinoplanes lobatus TaxID=113568 RepID=A0A7W7MKE2_9ACTN|nr:hypothetical protein [Actinoplanes lobatus]MBB4753662.1 hypothetical protein [Actinoplanes lobatus]GGN73105.1 hypothetical protein GCM10010112_42210 [Actinoplanes lobatus]